MVNAISRFGAYQSVQFEDPYTHKVIESMGGWIRLCAMKMDEMPFRAQEFQQYYKTYLLEEVGETQSYFTGLIPHQKPLMISAPTKKHKLSDDKFLEAPEKNQVLLNQQNKKP